jgi:hypothetical protein
MIPLGRSATNWSVVPDRGLWRIWWNQNWRGKPRYSGETCPNFALSTANPIGLELKSNSGRRGGKPATNCLSYGKAWVGTAASGF